MRTWCMTYGADSDEAECSSICLSGSRAAFMTLLFRWLLLTCTTAPITSKISRYLGRSALPVAWPQGPCHVCLESCHFCLGSCQSCRFILVLALA